MRIRLVVPLLTIVLCCGAYPSSWGGPQCSGTGSWRVDCNWCQCSRGIPVCTLKFCHGPPPPEPECNGIVNWKRDCNTCTCQNGLAVCTLIACRTGGGQHPRHGCSKPPRKCLHGFDAGPCKALFFRWGFNSATGQCEEFVYGGCGGNENNFETLEECERVCENTKRRRRVLKKN